MKVLYLDCFSGISGDMMVGALCDLGVKPSALEWELSKLEIGDFHMHFERAQRQKIEGVHFSIHEGATHTHGQGEGHSHEKAHDHGHGHEHHEQEHHHDHTHDHGHNHSHAHGHAHSHEHEDEHQHHEGGHEHHEATEAAHQHASSARLPHHNDQDHGTEVAGAQALHEAEHAHAHSHGHDCCGGHHHEHVHGRTHREIRALLESSGLSDFVKKHSLSIFQRIAVAEGKIHGMSPEDVHFHEVGALDSIADIVCACVGLEVLGVEKVYASPLNEGRGWIDCAHGRFPLPAPATLEILKGVTVGQTDETHELITPTGAALAAEFAESFGAMPRLKVEKIGYGVGSRNLSSRPNVLRAVLGETE